MRYWYKHQTGQRLTNAGREVAKELLKDKTCAECGAEIILIELPSTPYLACEKSSAHKCGFALPIGVNDQLPQVLVDGV